MMLACPNLVGCSIRAASQRFNRASPQYGKTRNAAVRLGTLMLTLMLVSACGVRGSDSGDSNPDTTPIAGSSIGADEFTRNAPATCSIDDQKSWVYDSMQDYYLFYDQVDNNVALSEYDSIESLITDLRVTPYDTFSYVTDQATHSARFDEGENFGFGWSLIRTEQDTFFFSLVEPGSPLADAGAERGDELVGINGLSMPDFLNLPAAQRTAALGEGTDVVSVTLSLRNALGTTRILTVTKATYSLQTVLDTNVIERNGVRTGYLHFYQFLDTSSVELAAAFDQFAASDVSEMVLDLRYNGGGRVAVANELASYLVGQGKTAQIFATYQPNDKYRQDSLDINFVNKVQALNLNRVFVLQGENTCSASELVVNGLRPFMEVITVGQTTCGKPYASSPNTACSKVINAIELELVNADGTGGYFDGITADCPAQDNVTQTLGNESEALLATALGYIETGSCPQVSRRARSANLPLPEWMRPIAGGSQM